MSLIQWDPNQKSVKAGSYSVSADIYHSFGRVQTNLLIEAYYTKLKHIFVVSPIGYDEEGNKLGGEFTKTVYSDYSGSLTYTVPEPATFAALLGMAALFFAARRRSK